MTETGVTGICRIRILAAGTAPIFLAATFFGRGPLFDAIQMEHFKANVTRPDGFFSFDFDDTYHAFVVVLR